MKKLLFPLFALIATFAFTACGSDDNDTPSPKPEPTPTEATLEAPSAEAVTLEYKYNATENWRANSTADWFTVSPALGTSGAGTITIAVKENLTNEAREAKFTLETVSSSKTFATITVKQPKREVTPGEDENPDAPAGMKKNASFLLKQIVVGWNLGNTLEATDEWSDEDGHHSGDGFSDYAPNLDTEIKWQPDRTTQAMMTKIKEAGFNAVRIPVRWYRHADANFNIHNEWMNRVKEVVDYAISQNMYVILNSHHDNWYDRMATIPDEADILGKFGKMWTQIATAFKGYDEHLIFAAVNEVIEDSNGPWYKDGEKWPWYNGTAITNGPNTTQQKLFDNMLQTFVDNVRATGGNNAWRNLMFQPWAASTAIAQYGTVNIPTDKVANRLIFEFHCYDPYNYCTAKSQHTVAESDKASIRTLLKNVNDRFVAKGIPAIMAEFGSSLDVSNSAKNAEYDKTRADYMEFIVSEAKQYNIPSFYWDNNAFKSGETFGLLDRASVSFDSRAQTALDGIMRGANK